MKEGLILSDVDGTICPLIVPSLIEYQSSQGLVDPLYHGLFIQNMQDFREGKTAYEEFAEYYLKFYALSLKGRTYEEALKTTWEFFIRNESFFYSPMRKLLTALGESHDLYFVTASPQFIAEAVSDIFGAHGHISSLFGIEDGILTGTVTSSIAAREAKEQAITSFLIGRNQRTLAFGDSIGDIKMLEVVDYPVCVNPSQELNDIAVQRNYPILLLDDLVNHTTEQLVDLVLPR